MNAEGTMFQLTHNKSNSAILQPYSTRDKSGIKGMLH